jgi:hypothetical protein
VDAIGIQSGTGTNGEWRLLPDGTQLCWGTLDLTIAINNTYGVLYQNTGTFSFPRAFSEPPNVSLGRAQWGTGASWGYVTDTTTTSATVRVLDAFPRADTTMTYVDYIAVGKGS